MQGLAFVAALALAAQAAAGAPPAADKPAAESPALEPAAAQAPPPPPADISRAVDANGVPRWAKGKPKQPVQACETKPNIGIETWREKYESTGKDQLKPKPPANVCH
jgi:hypothetical protein